MSRTHRPPDATRIWQHLEYLRWFKRQFPTKKSTWTTDRGKQSTIWTTPHGIGLIYSKDRGAELAETLRSSWVLFRWTQLRNCPWASFDAPLYLPSIYPDISKRLQFYQDLFRSFPEKDFRKASAIALALSWTPPAKPIHRR